MVTHARNERGLALLIAVIGLLVTGTVLSAFVVSGMMERREANSTLRSAQAFAVAEHGLNETIGNWTAASWNQMAVDSVAPVSGTTAGGSGSYAGTVRRLNQELFLVDITGIDAGTRARQNLGALLKLRLLEIEIQAALTTQGPTKVGGSAEIDGTNEDPSGWAGCAADSDLAGLRLPSASDLTTVGAGCAGAACITGSPGVDPDPTINDSTFFQYGDTDWDGLVAMASKVISSGTYNGIGPVIVSGTCVISNLSNWGDPITPTSACGGYFPIIYAGGDITINNGYGQGILLVDGDLSVQGGFEFYGVVIVKGKLKTAGTGGHFSGAVLAANVDLDDISVLGDALIQYSSCAITKVLESSGTGAMLRSRGWLYSY